MSDNTSTSIMFLIRFKSALPREELVRRYKKRMPEFRAFPGLVQKYYVYDPGTDEWGGCYYWASREALQAYLNSDLRKSIPAMYEMVGEARIDTFEIRDILRAQEGA